MSICSSNAKFIFIQVAYSCMALEFASYGLLLYGITRKFEEVVCFDAYQNLEVFRLINSSVNCSLLWKLKNQIVTKL